MLRAIIVLVLMLVGGARGSTAAEDIPWHADTWAFARIAVLNDPVARMTYATRALRRSNLGYTDVNSIVHTVTEAAEQHYKPAQLLLADFYHQGFGVEQDLTKALGLYRVASQDGDLYALVQMGFIHTCHCELYNPKRAFSYFRKAAEAHYGPAYLGLAEAYDYGMGVPHDWAKARVWYERAVAKKIPRAFYPLGHYYQLGRGGLEESDERAVAVFRAGAELGDWDSAFGLGQALVTGRGVAADIDEGRRWLEPLALQGHGLAQEALGLSYFTGERHPKFGAIAPGLAWLEKAGANGIGTAYETLAHHYMMEEMDYEMALHYARLGAQSPDHKAAEFLMGLIPLLEEYRDKSNSQKM